MKKPFVVSGTKGRSAVPPCFPLGSILQDVYDLLSQEPKPGCSFRDNGRNPLPTTYLHREGLPQVGRQASSAFQLCSRQASAHHERLAGLAPSPTRWWMAYYSCPNLIFTCQVDPVGFEPTTFSMPLRRAPSCAMGPRLPQVDLAGFEPATSSVRLMRAPNCATGPRRGVEIVPERK
jgi:hypothetical protein